MIDYKRKFIEFAFANGLRIFESSSDDKTLKNKRSSPWFLNVGDFNDGETLLRLSEAYAETIMASGVENIDLLYGIPEKGVSLAGPTATEMARKGRNVGWFFTRKLPKSHGEATGKTDLTKVVVGKVPKSGQSIVQLDDAFTAGDAKYAARQELQALGDFNLRLLVIALDRQEVTIEGKDAIAEYEKKTGTRVASVVTAVDIIDYLKEEQSRCGPSNGAGVKTRIERLSNYLRVYGTESARKYVGRLEQKIIGRDRSVIPACDLDSLEQFESLVKQTADIDGIGGYKIGFELGLSFGLPEVVRVARRHTDKPLIYDHQKAGTDIPDTGRNFARVMKKAGIDTVILFPQAGPETERAWIYQALDQGLKVIVGGRMTHPAYAVSEGGFITDEGALEMYRIAARAGINDFVVPGNKPEVIKHIRELVEAEGARPIFYAPGFIAQGGNINDAAKEAGERFHGIVGRGIYSAADMKRAAIEHTAQLG